MPADKNHPTYAIKINTKRQAWEFGAGSDMEHKMINCDRIHEHPDGIYEVFTKEASEGKGQMAKTGDYFKVDEENYPSPCERKWFQENHQHIEDDWYLQTAKPLKIWRKDDGESEEIDFLTGNGLLKIDPEDPDHYFSAMLWGTLETAHSDAVIVFYDVNRDENGKIISINFNFVDAGYFKSNYRIIEQG